MEAVVILEKLDNPLSIKYMLTPWKCLYALYGCKRKITAYL